MEKIVAIEASVVVYADQPTVSVTVKTERGFSGTAELPSGVSVGANEAKLVEPAQAVRTIAEVVAPSLTGLDALEQRELDERLMELDGTDDRSHLGVNSLLPVSLAICRAGAAALQRPLYAHVAELAHTEATAPQLVQVLIEGGKHAPTSGLSVQEFSLIGPPDAGERVLGMLQGLIAAQGVAVSVGNEGGLVAPFGTNEVALKYLASAVEQSGATELGFALDVAASHGSTPAEQLESWLRDYPLRLIEDPVSQDDLDAWRTFTATHGQQLLVAADDLTVGNPILIKEAVKQAVANCLVLKLNQTATLSELFDLIALVKVGGWAIMVSHRGHETPDSFLVDLAVGTGTQYLKMGTTRSSVRRPKFERFVQVQSQLSS